MSSNERRARMKRLICILSVLLLFAGCGPKDTNMKPTQTIIASAEDGLKYLGDHPPSGDSFQLAISGSFTFAGKPDAVGAGMAVLMDKILGLGYEPDGFEQKDGFRLYRYKKMR
jgi:hypothetical protein